MPIYIQKHLIIIHTQFICQQQVKKLRHGTGTVVVVLIPLKIKHFEYLFSVYFSVENFNLGKNFLSVQTTE